MKLVTKKRAYKLIGMQVALLIALIVTQMAMQFASSYKWVGFEKKDGKDSWYSVAMTAQASNSLCSIQLDKANEQISAFEKTRDEANKDLQ